MSKGADVRHAGRLFQRLAAETGNARLPTGLYGICCAMKQGSVDATSF